MAIAERRPLAEEAGILTAVGNTPLVRLNRLLGDLDIRLYAKLEAFNPGGSTKDRPATAIIRHCLEAGTIDRQTVVDRVELRQHGDRPGAGVPLLGLRFICVVDPKTDAAEPAAARGLRRRDRPRRREPDPVTGEFLQARLNRVQELLRHDRRQLLAEPVRERAQPARALPHDDARDRRRRSTARWTTCSAPPSTCGTITRLRRVRRATTALATRIVAVDAVGSLIFGERARASA